MTRATKTTYSGVVWRKGKKVLLRPLEEGDMELCNRWINDPDVNRFLLRTGPLTMRGQMEWYERVSKNDPDNLTVAICTLDGSLIGNMSMKVFPRKRIAVTGTLIGEKQHHGKGFGTDAKMLMLDYAFNWLDLRKVTSPIIAFNARSIRYAEKCGHREMGRIEQEHFRDGKWHDEVHMVVFKEEWLPLWEAYQNS